MNYFVQRGAEIIGPVSVDEQNARIAARDLQSDCLVTADLGDTPGRVARAKDKDWVYLSEIPGVVGLPPPETPRATVKSNPLRFVAAIFVFIIIVVALSGALQFLVALHGLR